MNNKRNRSDESRVLPIFVLTMVLLAVWSCGILYTMHFMGFVIVLMSSITISMMTIMDYAMIIGFSEGAAAIIGLCTFLIFVVNVHNLPSMGHVMQIVLEWIMFLVGFVFTSVLVRESIF